MVSTRHLVVLYICTNRNPNFHTNFHPAKVIAKKAGMKILSLAQTSSQKCKCALAAAVSALVKSFFPPQNLETKMSLKVVFLNIQLQNWASSKCFISKQNRTHSCLLAFIEKKKNRTIALPIHWSQKNHIYSCQGGFVLAYLWIMICT